MIHIKPTPAECLNANQYNELTIRWQERRISELEEALKLAKAMLEYNVRPSSTSKLTYSDFNKNDTCLVAINTVLENV